MPRCADRLRRLERRLAATRALDPATICARTIACYEYGPDVAPMPELAPAEQRLADAVVELLRATEHANQFQAPPA